jgi:arabinogalactan endo-1,4-beta-galactosidase
MKFKSILITLLAVGLLSFVNCKEDDNVTDPDDEQEPADLSNFYFGADLSYVNQVLDHNGTYRDNGTVKNPYAIFKDHGTKLVRLRLWHDPVWTKEVYGANGTQLYNDLYDVEKSMALAKTQGMAVLLDFHYSDSWADPGKQEIPQAWKEIKEISVLKDSVYQYTRKVLQYLKGKNLLPEMVQLGNEINCGMLYTDAPAGFPTCNNCNGQWQSLGEVINGGIQAVREISPVSSTGTKILLHVADPKNVEWWFDNIKGAGKVTDFDMIGFSYYPLWHTTVGVEALSDNIAKWRTQYNKDVMILETAYPWTTEGKDSYNNQFGGQTPLTGYPFTAKGQYDLLKKITQEVIDGGGRGVVYWEPAWISSGLKDLWGSGSSWENCTFFDFNGNVIQGIDFMKDAYK